MVMPLSYFDIEDKDAAHQDTSFLLADSLLCVAITEPAIHQIEQYFPSGEWMDWYSGKSYSGGKYHLIDVAWEQSPLFIRQGSAVFLDNKFDQQSLPELQFYIGAKVSGQAEFYDDDGDSFAYQKGDYKRSTLHWTTTNKAADVTIVQDGQYQPNYSQVKLSLKVTAQCPVQVVLNDRSLEQALYKNRLTKNHWYFDVAEQTVHILLDPEFWSHTSQLQLAFDQAIKISQDD
jgi:alpha-glucosidase